MASDLHPTLKRGPCRTLSHQSKSWHHMRADLVRRTGLDREETAFIADRHLVLLNLQGHSSGASIFWTTAELISCAENRAQSSSFQLAVSGGAGKRGRPMPPICLSASIPQSSRICLHLRNHAPCPAFPFRPILALKIPLSRMQCAGSARKFGRRVH